MSHYLPSDDYLLSESHQLGIGSSSINQTYLNLRALSNAPSDALSLVKVACLGKADKLS